MGNSMILKAFFLTLGQIGDPRFRRVLMLGIVLTLLLLIAATTGFVWLVGWATGDIAMLNSMSWMQDVLSWGSVIIMLILSVFLMVPVASAITSMFLEEVAKAVEDKHYPNLPPAETVPFSDALRDTVNFLGVLILANALAFVLYISLPIANLMIFWGLNGFLLGREYFTLAATRRIGRTKATQMRKQHQGVIWLAGVLMAMPLTVPVLNLVVPILGAATFTHLFHLLLAKSSRV